MKRAAPTASLQPVSEHSVAAQRGRVAVDSRWGVDLKGPARRWRKLRGDQFTGPYAQPVRRTVSSAAGGVGAIAGGAVCGFIASAVASPVRSRRPLPFLQTALTAMGGLHSHEQSEAHGATRPHWRPRPPAHGRLTGAARAGRHGRHLCAVQRSRMPGYSCIVCRVCIHGLSALSIDIL